MSNPTQLFVTNLNDRIKEADLVSLLYELFSPYGEVLTVRLAKGKNSKGSPLRGTAFVTFKSPAQTAAGMRNLNNADFLGKPIRVQLALKRAKPTRRSAKMDIAE